MTTPILTGFFDVYEYSETAKNHKGRKLTDEERIQFVTNFDQDKLPEELREFALIPEDKTKSARVVFKVGKFCEWYGANKEQINRPTNDSLDGKRYRVFIEYNTLRSDVPKKPTGYWANAVLIVSEVAKYFASIDLGADAPKVAAQAVQVKSAEELAGVDENAVSSVHAAPSAPAVPKQPAPFPEAEEDDAPVLPF